MLSGESLFHRHQLEHPLVEPHPAGYAPDDFGRLRIAHIEGGFEFLSDFRLVVAPKI
jgi:hypothetical protein